VRMTLSKGLRLWSKCFTDEGASYEGSQMLEKCSWLVPSQHSLGSFPVDVARTLQSLEVTVELAKFPHQRVCKASSASHQRLCLGHRFLWETPPLHQAMNCLKQSSTRRHTHRSKPLYRPNCITASCRTRSIVVEGASSAACLQQ
jgi:hypothetical protein